MGWVAGIRAISLLVDVAGQAAGYESELPYLAALLIFAIGSNVAAFFAEEGKAWSLGVGLVCGCVAMLAFPFGTVAGSIFLLCLGVGLLRARRGTAAA
jgi:hypothetical protein